MASATWYTTDDSYVTVSGDTPVTITRSSTAWRGAAYTDEVDVPNTISGIVMSSTETAAVGFTNTSTFYAGDPSFNENRILYGWWFHDPSGKWYIMNEGSTDGYVTGDKWDIGKAVFSGSDVKLYLNDVLEKTISSPAVTSDLFAGCAIYDGSVQCTVSADDPSPTGTRLPPPPIEYSL